MKMNIPITKTIFGDEEKKAIVKPLETGWVVQGPNVAKFQNMFADFTGSKYAHAASNCTTALHLGLEAMGITKGDKVIVPSFTYVASANAVEYTGAEVVFCDIDLKTFNIDETKLEEMIKNDNSIKAIMPVNLFGLCANMPYIIELAKKYNLKVIEDSACGFDGWIGDKHSGTFGDCGCFSFHPRKSICTGEGGMLITDDEDIANKVSQLKDHGASKSDLQRHKEKGGSLLPDFTMRGYNYRMTDMQGALGVCQMDRKEYIMNGRREVASKYDIVLKDISQLVSPYIPENYKHGYQSYVCIFTDGEDISNLTKEQIDRINIKRNIFMEKLEEMTIATRQGTHAVHTLAYYKNKNNFKDEDFLMSYAADRLSIALPLYAGMTNEEFDYVISNIKEALK
ncbi:DegT/DnrJ/EryC1/StrS family aminotransferase [Aliarcobacter butzleri]|uniref:DegT/DnrJ/EryC1/StrS family aminotransferase n=1 Tax=Aliarcobacter butzleri TaxID=28197 RepID=A0AAW7PN90_9BACT|nr:DegT/DnrJ/EryC1/StrS family aminotransferase [Aliarcobacter butzleri]MDN5062721.1 DegT/DnrJ/EryC1/StrS family aminotransferase [Aliarcobacter butzleri]MDN5065588.1 DegT/DnrJ/EryC1/StrS family aminotransferase [Aliarcobacter butzleri]